ncbi:MAG: MFS transporter [Phycisphaeraceae bacterium]|nr:MFS transporter [Phycisphaeraceae bacterium]
MSNESGGSAVRDGLPFGVTEAADIAPPGERFGSPSGNDRVVVAHMGRAPSVAERANPEVRAVARKRYWLLNASHTLVDVYPIFFVSLIVLLTNRLDLAAWQVATVFALTPIFSGALQPFFAILTDRRDTRICGPLGMFLGAVCISSIGFAQNFWQLIALQIVGVIGTGMYHPIAAALAGQVGTRAIARGRGWALAIFFTFGMLGQAMGAQMAPTIATRYGLESLALLAIPGVIAAVGLHVLLRHVPHRHENHRDLHASIGDAESRKRWRAVLTICAANCLLYTVNIGVFAMLSVWAKSQHPTSTDAATKLHGTLVAFATVGMGLAGLFASRVIRPGKEKWPIVALCVVGALLASSFGFVGDFGVRVGAGTFWAFWPAYAWAAITAVGFFATMPVSIALGQRLLPGRTGLVSSLLMGVGWAFSASAPFIAPLFLGGVSLRDAYMLPKWRIDMGFVGFAALAILAAALYLTIDRKVVERAATE